MEVSFSPPNLKRIGYPKNTIYMKKIEIQIIVEEDKVATAIKTNGYSDDNISDQFELLGIIENAKGIIQERIKKLADVRGKI